MAAQEPRSSEHDYAVLAAKMNEVDAQAPTHVQGTLSAYVDAPELGPGGKRRVPMPGSDESIRAILDKPGPALSTPTMGANELARDLSEFASELLGYASRLAGSSAGLGIVEETRLVYGRLDSMTDSVRDFAARHNVELTRHNVSLARDPQEIELGTVATAMVKAQARDIALAVMSAFEMNKILQSQVARAASGDYINFRVAIER